MIWLPTVDQLVQLHEKIVLRTGGTGGVRDIGLVESALMRARSSFSGVECYPAIADKAAAVCCGLIGNHGFIDGNKRIGVMAMLLILKKNDVQLEYTQAELVQLGLDAAKGILSVEDVSAWIEFHTCV